MFSVLSLDGSASSSPSLPTFAKDAGDPFPLHLSLVLLLFRPFTVPYQYNYSVFVSPGVCDPHTALLLQWPMVPLSARSRANTYITFPVPVTHHRENVKLQNCVDKMILPCLAGAILARLYPRVLLRYLCVKSDRDTNCKINLSVKL